MYTSPRPPVASPASRYTSPAFSSRYSSPVVASRYTSPNTPSTPSSYAPATPENYRMKRLSFSPEVLKADATRNWRSRASQNGIRVEDDEEEALSNASFDARDASFDAPLLPPFLTAPRRRALSYASENLPHTPPRNPHIAAHLRLKGSVTAPAHERRAFGIKSNLPNVDEDELFVEPQQPPSQTHCSSCAVASKQLALLSPCTHALCPSCLTSALNIVDQLSMHCVVCRATVATFGLVRAPPSPALDESFMLPFSPPSSPSANEDPDPVVLRIDNVPWDITPPAILAFLGVSAASGARAHVLLDRLGKTLSHAFVELPTEAVARSVLRGEHRAAPVLGTGRRARAVTLTRSSQSALMAAIFPNWAGAFDGPEGAPSLVGVAGPSLPGALEGGLMRESELTDLLYLMRTQDNGARFVKVPGLPFYALVSILAKFPTDRDSRVFWGAGLRDLLYDVTYAAIQVLRARTTANEDGALVRELVRTGPWLRGLSEFDAPSPPRSDADTDEAEFHARQHEQPQQQCHAYAPPASPIRSYEPLLAFGPPSPPALQPASIPTSDSNSSTSTTQEPDMKDATARMSELAREFGVERELVEALVLRLGINGPAASAA
ncbi:RING-type domain-containing protein [Mycena sanguinolenta]|uniref:RING-type domain-containing protein n=1 Tax=Mycena sanguinolenta TaxID=230812 RepID=A0A8H7CVU7_9AGAR|nr:RING-type domain-containing protein [Mycena sanguinolenta]